MAQHFDLDRILSQLVKMHGADAVIASLRNATRNITADSVTKVVGGSDPDPTGTLSPDDIAEAVYASHLTRCPHCNGFIQLVAKP